MRDIKFRAYDKAYERMFTAEMLQQASNGLVAAANERLDQERRFDNYNRSPGGFFIPTKDENMEIMQYTGRKDQNGKEIYEGDIVEYDDYLWTIEYSKENGAFILNSYDILENFINTDSKWVEVIGNIYENPNLLQEEN